MPVEGENPLSAKELLRLARLCRISLSLESIPSSSTQLDQRQLHAALGLVRQVESLDEQGVKRKSDVIMAVVRWCAQINALALDPSVTPMVSSVEEIGLRLREDVAMAVEEDVLGNAKNVDQSFVVVPRAVDGSE